MVGARRDRTHDIHLFLSGCTEIYPRSGHAEISPREDSPGGLLRRAQKEGAWPLHSQPCSVSSPALWSHTHCAPSRCSDLGVSGLRNPGPNPRPSPTLRQDRPGSRGRSSPSPGPRQRTGKPGRKGKGRGRAPARDAPPPGDTLQPGCSAPLLLLPLPSGAEMGEGACRWTLGWGGGAQGLEAPTLGEESWAAAGRGDSGPAGAAGGGARSPAGPPARVPGWAAAARHGLARRGAPGTGRRLSGPGGAIPASHGRRRRLGSAARLGLRGSAGGAGSGWGRGRGRAPPGLGLGLGAPGWLRPRATRPGLRTWRSARSQGEVLGTGRGARPRADLGAPRHRKRPTRTRQTRADPAHAGVHT